MADEKTPEQIRQEAMQQQAALDAQEQAKKFREIGGAALSGPGTGVLNVSGSEEAQQGALEGLQFGQMLYGQGIADVGKEAQEYSSMVKSGLNKDYAGADYQRQLSNMALAKQNAKIGLGGTNSLAAQEQLRRQGSMQAAQMNQDYQDKRLALYGKNISAKQSGMASQYFAGKGTGQAATQTPVAESGGTMPCFALVLVGAMSKETYASESLFVNKHSLEYIGYSMISAPIVYMILKFNLFAKIYSFFAHKYINEKLGKSNFVGKMVKLIGEPICRVVGFIC